MPCSPAKYPLFASDVLISDLQHHLWRLSLDGALHLAPLSLTTDTALDLGTGTGIWAIEFADENPSAIVTGVDLSPIQPRWVPPNCEFQIDDVEADWTYPPPSLDPSEGRGGGFDYIHCRMLSMGLKNWPLLFQRSFEFLRPGGYFEAQEFDILVQTEPDGSKTGTSFRKWCEKLIAAAMKAGINARAPLKFRDQLTEAGFVDIQSKTIRWPVGPWPESKKDKTLGVWAQRNMIDGLEAAAMGFLSRYDGWTREEVLELVNAAKTKFSIPISISM